MESDETRENFIFFLLGYISMMANTKGIIDPDMVIATTNETLDMVLQYLNMQPLTENEKKYIVKCDEWMKLLYDSYLQKDPEYNE